MLSTLKKIKEVTGLPVKPFQLGAKDGICYKIVSANNDGAKRQTRLELRIITDTIDESEVIKDKICNALITIGDEKKLEDVEWCYLNGGGQLFDVNTKTFHTILYLYLLQKGVK